LESVAYFSPRKNVVLKRHIYHAIHHNYTIKTPRSAPRFSQNPLQKRQFTTAEKNIFAKSIFLPHKQQKAGIAPGLSVYRISQTKR